MAARSRDGILIVYTARSINLYWCKMVIGLLLFWDVTSVILIHISFPQEFYPYSENICETSVYFIPWLYRQLSPGNLEVESIKDIGIYLTLRLLHCGKFRLPFDFDFHL